MPGAVNARMRQQVEYTTDRRGWGLFARLSAVHQRGLAGRETRPVVERNAWWNGRIHASPQRFVGMANVAAVRPVVERNAELTDVRSAGFEDPAQRLFRERAERRRR